jgi:hypothetical protein
VIGEKLAPAYIDRKLGREGYAGEQTATPADPDRPDNLWGPAPGAYGAHGPFDDRAKDFSAELWVAKRTPWFALAAATIAGVALATMGNRDA